MLPPHARVTLSLILGALLALNAPLRPPLSDPLASNLTGPPGRNLADPRGQERLTATYGTLPLSFEANRARPTRTLISWPVVRATPCS